MSETADRPDGGVDNGRCQFPTGRDQVCGRAVRPSEGGPGRPSRYCDDPGHTRAKAFAARRAFALAGAPGAAGADPSPGGAELAARPVTDGRATFGVLLAQLGELAEAHRRSGAEQYGQMEALLGRAVEVAATVADPDAAAYEVEQVQRETGVRVAEAQTGQAAAERAAREARRRADEEAERRAQAEQAAEDALAAAGTARAETVAAAERVDAAEAAQQASAAAAQEEIARIRREAELAVDAVRVETQQQLRDAADAHDRAVTALEQQHRDRLEEARRVADERAAHAEEQADRARRDAAAEISAAQTRTGEATAAATRAEAAQAAADRRAADAHAVAERLRTQLDEQTDRHRGEVEQLLRDAAAERATLRDQAAAQLHDLLTRLAPERPPHSPTGQAADTDPAGEPPPESRAARPARGRRSTRSAVPNPGPDLPEGDTP